MLFCLHISVHVFSRTIVTRSLLLRFRWQHSFRAKLRNQWRKPAGMRRPATVLHNGFKLTPISLLESLEIHSESFAAHSRLPVVISATLRKCSLAPIESLSIATKQKESLMQQPSSTLANLSRPPGKHSSSTQVVC